MTVFVPSSPTPTIGSVLDVSADSVQKLDAGAFEMIDCLSRWGVGSGDLLARSSTLSPK